MNLNRPLFVLAGLFALLAASALLAAPNATPTTATGTATPAVAAVPADAAPPSLAGAPGEAQVLRGEYLARAGDCISCHTRPGGAPYAGGLPMKTPFGTIISSNITPEPQQGIGQYTQEDFARALREGRARDGHHLYPAMPYTNFSRLSDADLQALYTYFMHGVRPARQDNPATDLAWPFSMRGLMAVWNWLYLPDKRFEPEPARSAQWNRGAYLVQGLGHCSACHTPRSFTGAEKAASHQGGDAFLSGALIDGWYAQPLRNTPSPGLGAWSVNDIVDYLKTGRNARTAAFGLMSEVVGNSTQYLTREDLGAIATYLKSTGGEGDSAVTPPSAATDATAAALRQGETSKPGSLVFLNNCAGCHRSDGEGARRTFPSLAHNSAVAAANPTSLIRIVLHGSAMAHTGEAPSQLAMPALGWRLSDANVADVLSFVRSSWGNQAAPVTAQQVARVRADVRSAGQGGSR